MSLAHLLFGWRGRVNRAKLWLFVLLAYVAWGVVAVLAYYLGGMEQFARAGTMPDPAALDRLLFASSAPILIIVLFGVLLFYCGLAMLAKRLHDRDKSAWWLLVFVGLPAFIDGAVIGIATWLGNKHAVAGLLANLSSVVTLLIYLWAFVELYSLRGTTGGNRYGPDPLSRS